MRMRRRRQPLRPAAALSSRRRVATLHSAAPALTPRAVRSQGRSQLHPSPVSPADPPPSHRGPLTFHGLSRSAGAV